MTELNTLKGEVAAAKLITGEEIITRVVDVGTNYVTVRRPLALVMIASPDADNQGQVSFAPWMLAIDDNQPMIMDLSKIIYIGPARKDAAEQYMEATGDRPVTNNPPPVRGLAAGKLSRG